MNIDATNLILGRMAAVAAKKALLGEEIKIFNCSNAVVTGRKNFLVKDYARRNAQGTHTTGPYLPKTPFKFVKRTVRGMLPFKNTRGKEAYKRILCFNNVPAEFKELKLETIKEANIDNSLMSRYMTVKQICLSIGGKVE